MFVLDTNILSAMMGLQPVPQVRAWMNRQPEDLLFTTSISHAEIFSGLAIMANGHRRRGLEAAATSIFTDEFDGRVLPFDMEAASAYAGIFAVRRRAGRPAATFHLMIAAIARSRGASVVTRDTDGFADCGVTLIDPWTAS